MTYKFEIFVFFCVILATFAVEQKFPLNGYEKYYGNVTCSPSSTVPKRDKEISGNVTDNG
jgi:hypothetical protein